MERWVYDHTLPSQMRREFPWIVIGALADYYETNNSWQGECLESWDRIEAFYRDPAYNRVPYPEMQHLIAQLQAKGYDKTLRAGQSLWTLVLSRSKRHGLREDQPCLRLNFEGPNRVLHINVNSRPSLLFDTRDLTPEIEALLRQLEGHDID